LNVLDNNNLSDNSVESNINWGNYLFRNFDNLLDNYLSVDINNLLLWNLFVDFVDHWNFDHLFQDDFLVNNNVLLDFNDLLNNVFFLNNC